jgi:hypothetical protein
MNAVPPVSPTADTPTALDEDGINNKLSELISQNAQFVEALGTCKWTNESVKNVIGGEFRAAKYRLSSASLNWEITDISIAFIGPLDSPTHLSFIASGTHEQGPASFQVIIDLAKPMKYETSEIDHVLPEPFEDEIDRKRLADVKKKLAASLRPREGAPGNLEVIRQKSIDAFVQDRQLNSMLLHSGYSIGEAVQEVNDTVRHLQSDFQGLRDLEWQVSDIKVEYLGLPQAPSHISFEIIGSHQNGPVTFKMFLSISDGQWSTAFEPPSEAF